jgi:hypothetical protein
MNTRFHLMSGRRIGSAVAALFCLALGLFLVGNILNVEAQDDDLRLNHFHHFGGDVLYCLDGDRKQTTTFFIPGEGGGFQLVDMSGQEIWFVDEALVYAAIDAAKANNSLELVDEGFGTYGPVSLYVFIGENDTPYFIFNGYDEHGKTNTMTFRFCEPVRPGNFGDDPDGTEPQVEETPDPLPDNVPFD